LECSAWETLRQHLDLAGSSMRRQILDENFHMMKSNGIAPSKLPCGYAPMFAYIGREGCLADLELREGRLHSQKGTPEFLKETIGS